MAAMAEPDQVILFDTPQALAHRTLIASFAVAAASHSKLIATP